MPVFMSMYSCVCVYVLYVCTHMIGCEARAVEFGHCSCFRAVKEDSCIGWEAWQTCLEFVFDAFVLLNGHAHHRPMRQCWTRSFIARLLFWSWKPIQSGCQPPSKRWDGLFCLPFLHQPLLLFLFLLLNAPSLLSMHFEDVVYFCPGSVIKAHIKLWCVLQAVKSHLHWEQMMAWWLSFGRVHGHCSLVW